MAKKQTVDHMTREQTLDYITAKHGRKLQDAGVELTDTPENLFYILFDVMLYASAGVTEQEAVADAKIAQLIADKEAADPKNAQLVADEAAGE